MAYTAAYTYRTAVRSKRRSATPKKRVSAERKADQIRRVAKAKSGVSGMQRQGKKTLRSKLQRSKSALAKGLALAARKKRVIARGKAGISASALKKRRKSQAKYGVGGKGRARADSAGASARAVAQGRVPRRRRAAPRLLRCIVCGGVVPWISVDRRCFPCLKRGIAARKREDEFSLGMFDIEEEFVPAVQ